MEKEGSVSTDHAKVMVEERTVGADEKDESNEGGRFENSSKRTVKTTHRLLRHDIVGGHFDRSGGLVVFGLRVHCV